jgi:hypothetical protein
MIPQNEELLILYLCGGITGNDVTQQVGANYVCISVGQIV